MSSSHSSRFGYVMLLALLVLWPVMIVLRQRRRSVVYRPLSDEDFVLAVVGIVGALAAVFLPILIHRQGLSRHLHDRRRTWNENGHLCERVGLRASPANRRAGYAKGGV